MSDLDEIKAALDAKGEAEEIKPEVKGGGKKKNVEAKKSATTTLVNDYYVNGVTFQVERDSDDVIIPHYKRPGDACLDTYVYKFLSLKNEMGVEMIKEGEDPDSITLHQGWIAIIYTGIKCKLEQGWGMDVKIRSGVGKEGVILLNAPGKVDTLYTGKICLMVTKINKVPMTIHKKDRIAQIEPVPQIYLDWTIVDKITTEEGNTRGEAGLGSSGIK